jgi:hypothetical protein
MVSIRTTMVRFVGFTLMHPDFPRITWNVSQIEHDTFHGRFGEPEGILFSELTDHPENDKWKHLDRAKVLRYATETKVLIFPREDKL